MELVVAGELMTRSGIWFWDGRMGTYSRLGLHSSSSEMLAGIPRRSDSQRDLALF